MSSSPRKLFVPIMVSAFAVALLSTPVLAQSADSMEQIKNQLLSGIPMAGAVALQQMRPDSQEVKNIPLVAIRQPQHIQPTAAPASIENL